MVVLSCRITLRLPESHSLKDKRQIVRSVLHRLQNRENVSVLELEEARDSWQAAVLGLALVARDRAGAQSHLERVRREVEEESGLKYVEFECDFR